MSHFHWDNLAHMDGPLHRLDARVKFVLFVLLLLTTVSIPPGREKAFLGLTLLWIILAAWSRVPFLRLASGLIVITPFLLMTAFLWCLPTNASFNRDLYLSASAKALSGVLWIGLLMSTTRFADLLGALRQLKVPSLAVRLLGLSYRFLFVFTEEAARMKRSMTARAFEDRWLWQARTVGRMLGVLFLRAYERGERVYLAMVSRGYGQEPTSTPAAFPPLQQILAAGLVLTIALSARLFL